MRKLIITTATAIVVAIGMVGATAPAFADPVKPDPTVTSMPQMQKTKPVGIKAPKGHLNGGNNKVAPNSTSAACAPVCYIYMAGAQVLNATTQADGSTADFTVAKPVMSNPDDFHTLLEKAVSGEDNGDTVEVGINVDPVVNGDSNPHLFVFSWVDDAPGSYNGGNGWVDAVGCNPCAGDSLNGVVGTSKSLTIQHVTGGWLVSYNGSPVGSYPDMTWGGTFTKIRLVQNFGEIAAADDKTCSDAGTGAHAGLSASAEIKNYALINSTASPVMVQNVVTDPTIWAYTQPSSTYIRVGGEGYNSIGDALGTKGSCAGAAEGTPAASSLQVWKEACPDGAAVTGCNSAWSVPWSGQTINACHPVTAPNDKWRRVWGNYLSSGKSFYVYASGSCGSTRQLVTNASKLVTPWDIHGWARAA